MKTIGIVTATRAEYGLLKPFIIELRKSESEDFRVELIVTGTHLSDQYGRTVSEIREDNVRIDAEIVIHTESRSAIDISKNQADIVTKFTEFFLKKKYHAVVIFGDRYEMLMIAVSAVNTGIPIFHISGGDITEGAVDDSIRHSITKMSLYHFTTNEESRKRVIQLGENPDRVFNVGATGIDNIRSIELLSKNQALNSIGLKDCDYALCTYHPVTLEPQNAEKGINELLGAIRRFPDLQFIITKANADLGGDRINEILDNIASVEENIHVFASLGSRRYLSLMKHAVFILGNSSSGIVEAPSMKIPTVNIGDRQRGRLKSDSIINCGINKEEISEAIRLALSDEMKKKSRLASSKYGDGTASIKMASLCIELMSRPLDLMKRFYDIDWTYGD